MEHSTNKNHLNSYQINEYLDNTLSPGERAIVETHLASCEECKAILIEFETLFFRLTLLDEIELEKNLVPGVLARIHVNREISKVIKWGMMLQLSVVFVGLILIMPKLNQASFLTIIPFDNLRMVVSIQESFIKLYSEILSWWAGLQLILPTASRVLKIQPNLHLTQGTIWVLFISTALLWLFGNGFVLGNINKNDNY